MTAHPPKHRLAPPRPPRRSRTGARLTAAVARVRRAGLLIRFGALSAVLVLALGLVLGGVLKSTVEGRALAQAESTAGSVARMAVQPHLLRSDFRDGRIAADRLADLDMGMRDAGSDVQVLRVKVFDPHGTLMYSDEPGLIGQRNTSEDFHEAMDGEVVSEIEHEADSHSESAFGTMLEVYVPVLMDTARGEQVVGVFEMYLPYGPIEQGVAADVRKLHLFLAVGLVFLWAGLFRLMVMAARKLRQHAAASRWLARHDVLTELPNRTLFTELAGRAVERAHRGDSSAAVLVVDLERFMEVNDTLGHHVGDALLRAVGERLRERVADGADSPGTVARLGGDEYAVLLPEVADTAAAKRVAEGLLAALRTPFVVDDLTLEIDASIGVACCPEHADDEGGLLRRADAALYQAKQNHDGVVVYQPELDVHTPARLAMFGELRRAIDEDQLLLHYQPKAHLGDGRVTGVEALVRWQHPQRGLLSPADFIPVAEQTGLVRPMTLRILELALCDCRIWRDGGLELTVAVNLSARSLLDDGLPGQVEQLLEVYGLPAEALELEITETTAMVDPGRALSVLMSLRELGVRLSVDDFGTGHSSLSYLHQLPVDTLKIDRSFVQTMDSNRHEATIVKSTIDLARSLGLRVVAEGVETEAAWHHLRRLGCDAAQGYWLARPGAAEDVLQTIAVLERRLSRQVAAHPAA